MKNYIQTDDIIEVAAPADVAGGAGVLIGALFGIATHDAKSAATLQIKTRGVFDVAKVSAQQWATVGLAIYWDDTAKNFTTVSTSNTLVAKNTLVAANPSATGRVRLDG